jgi:uncharacterized protein YqeY
MQLEEQIKNDLKDAIKSGESATRDVLRLLTSDMKNEAIKTRLELEDKDVLAVLKKNIKSRKDSIEQFIAGGRADLADKERAELSIIEKYMPPEMGAEEVEKIVKDTITKMDAASTTNFGSVMKAVMKAVDGRADGSVVSQTVKKALIG